MSAFVANKRTGVINTFLKESGVVMHTLVDENDQLWEHHAKLSAENGALKEQLALMQLGHDMAAEGRLQYRQIPSFVRTKHSEGKTATELRQVFEATRDLSPAEKERGQKTSGVREVEQAVGPSVISDRTLSMMARMQQI